MKVYCVMILYSNTADGYALHSIHSTKEGADKRVAGFYEYEYSDTYVEEWEVEE